LAARTAWGGNIGGPPKIGPQPCVPQPADNRAGVAVNHITPKAASPHRASVRIGPVPPWFSFVCGFVPQNGRAYSTALDQEKGQFLSSRDSAQVTNFLAEITNALRLGVFARASLAQRRQVAKNGAWLIR
jgi:hypothetical protein